jgi:hypothetical protein
LEWNNVVTLTSFVLVLPFLGRVMRAVPLITKDGFRVRNDLELLTDKGIIGE